jgi:hypothetical protein
MSQWQTQQFYNIKALIMKKVLFALMFVSLASMAFAHGDKPTKAKGAELRAELLELIGTPPIEGSLEERIQIHFTINAKNEIVILSTNNNQLDHYVKSRLNYKQLSTGDIIINERYTLPLVVRKG